MNLLLLLLRGSWRVALLAGLLGAASGAASVTLLGLILHTVRDPATAGSGLVALFAALCGVVLVTQVGSQMLVARLTERTIQELQIGLCRQILNAPVRHLEQIGSPRLLAALMGDVNTITQALRGVPVLVVNIVVLGAVAGYLGTLSANLLAAALVCCFLGMASYWYAARFAERHIHKARDQQDTLQRRIQELIEGLKQLKMHGNRRSEFFDTVLVPAGAAARNSQFQADCVQSAAIGWGRLSFFIVIGLLLFVWPRFAAVDAGTLTSYAVTIIYLMSPLEQIMGWLPYMSWACASVRQVEQLGLLIHDEALERAAVPHLADWSRIDLQGVTHTHNTDGRKHGFTLGPLHLTVHRGEMIFVIGGNGSGKTTFGKLLTGLYAPDTGALCVDGELVTSANRESYRELFSVVFDDAVVFDSLWGVAGADRDQRAAELLRQLELSEIVQVANGNFSTTMLSRGQRKRLALLTACLEDRSLYVFDEWAADQDPAFRQVFYLELLPELKRRGKTIVAVTHDDRYFDGADRLIKLEEGRVVEITQQNAERRPATLVSTGGSV